MEMNALDEQLIVRYLLGDLPEDEQARLEDRAFAERGYLRHIEDAENDLIDEYVRGALTETKRRQFETRFLASAERRKKVEFARALARIIPTPEAAPKSATAAWWERLTAFLHGWNPVLQFSMAVAALLLVISVVWLFTLTRGLRSELAQLQTQQQAEQQARQQQLEALRQQTASERTRNADLTAQLERERTHSQELARQLERQQTSETSPPLFASLFLPPGIARGSAESLKLTIPARAQTARLQVGLERGDDFKSYRIELRAAQGQPVWAQDRLQPQTARAGRVIRLAVPVSKLSAGQYELTLKGVTSAQQTEEVRYYYFEVLK